MFEDKWKTPLRGCFAEI